jgi:bifunctional NMN adenylyltransferase/nudix hydrolase
MKSAANTSLDFLVFIGRFEPFHNGHLAVLIRALSLAKEVIIVLGSAQKPRSVKNPWNTAERQVMIQHACPPAAVGRVHITTVCDMLYNDEQWVRSVQSQVTQVVRELATETTPNIGIIGYHKDESSFYLDMFPQWEAVEVKPIDGLSATQLRDAWLAQDNTQGNAMLIESAVPRPVYDFLQSFKRMPAYPQLVAEQGFIKQYKQAWSVAPYAPTFVTTDAIVVHSGHVLMVRRRAEPGKGLWAWPGGFLNPHERIFDACIRELREETKLKLPSPVLRGSLKHQRVFDHPERSARGRTITHAFFFEFPAGELPSVKGSDDADKARWIPLSQFFEMREQLFEDHFDIGHYFLGGV